MSADQDIKCISVGDIANELARQGINPGEAVQKAKDEFPKKVAELLDKGWKIITGDSTTVYLRKNKKK